MALTVFAEKMGLFHKGSDGKGIGPADVCLSPPPPPAGPVPIPYVNMIQASDLTDGSQTVLIDGEPTALEDASTISTSKGDEAGTQGGNVITHKTSGKAAFTLWSFTVKIEGKGVCRHGDMLGQNEASSPPGCVDAAAITSFKAFDWVDTETPCKPNSYPGNEGTSDEQKAATRGGPCWQGGASCTTASGGRAARAAKGGLAAFAEGEYFTPDHQPPQVVAWYMGGCNDPKEFKKWAKSKDSVKPHCKCCSNSQGGTMSHVTVADIRSWM